LLPASRTTMFADCLLECTGDNDLGQRSRRPCVCMYDSPAATKVYTELSVYRKKRNLHRSTEG